MSGKEYWPTTRGGKSGGRVVKGIKPGSVLVGGSEGL